MKTITSLSQLGIKPDSRVLVLMPHPDDEAVFVSGLLKKLTRAKVATRLVTLTEGEASSLRYGLKPEDDLAEARKKELKKALHVLGVSDYAHTNFPDGGLRKNFRQLTQFVKNQVKNYQPTHTLTLEPDGIYGHADHISLTEAVDLATKPPARLLYATVNSMKIPQAVSHMSEKELIQPIEPEFCLKLSWAESLAKIRSLRAHRTQLKVSRSNSQDYNFFKTNKMITHEYFTYRE